MRSSSALIEESYTLVNKLPVSPLTASPLVSKRKRVVSAKESDNALLALEKRQRLAEVANNASQWDVDFTENQERLTNLAARNGKEASSASRQRPRRKTKVQLEKEKKDAEMAALSGDSDGE